MRLGRMSVCTPAAGQLELHNGLYRAQYTQRGPESAAPVLLGGRVPRQRHTTCRRPARGSGSCRVGCARWPRRPAGASCDRMCNGESARQVVGAGLCRLRLCRTASRAALRWGPPGAAVPSRPPEAPPTTLSRRRGGERAVRRSARCSAARACAGGTVCRVQRPAAHRSASYVRSHASCATASSAADSASASSSSSGEAARRRVGTSCILVLFSSCCARGSTARLTIPPATSAPECVCCYSSDRNAAGRDTLERLALLSGRGA